MYYPAVVQSTSAGIWPNMYQINPQQAIPTVYYQMPSMTVPPIQTGATSEVMVQQQPQTNSITTTKTITTRILDPTTVTKSEIPGTQTIITSTANTSVPPVTTTTTVVPNVETTTINERPRNQLRGLRSLSSSTYSDDTTTSLNSTVTSQPETIKQETVLPPPPVPIQTTAMAPVRRVIHHPDRLYTPSGYYSSDLDYGRRKIYKTDYKYRHYYCCNLCKGRCDLHNRSYSCCEWFYGCPVWALIICGLLFLALLVTFFTLFGLQPSINPTRRASTAEILLLNRTQIIYGFYKNCGYQVNASAGTQTTLILCTNTATTTTARIQLSPFYTVISGTNYNSSCRILILFCYLFIVKISQSNICT